MEDTQPVLTQTGDPFETRLGEPVAIFHGQSFGWKDIFFLVVPGILLTLALTGVGLWRVQHQTIQVGAIQAFNNNQTWFILAYLTFLFFFSMTLVRIGDDLRFVSIHQGGLRWRLSGLRVRSAHWGNIEGIATSTFRDYFFKLPLREHYHALLYLTAGKPVAFYENLLNLPELVTRVKANLYPRLLNDYKTALESDHQLIFGALMLHKSGLKIRSKSIKTEFPKNLHAKSAYRFLPWSEIEQVTIQSGFLVVKSSNYGFLRIPVSHIPNYELLFKLIEQGINQ